MHTWDLAFLTAIPSPGGCPQHLREYIDVTAGPSFARVPQLIGSLNFRGKGILTEYFRIFEDRYPTTRSSGFWFYKSNMGLQAIYDCGVDMDKVWYEIFGNKAAHFQDVIEPPPGWRPWNNKDAVFPTVFVDTKDLTRKDQYCAQWFGGRAQGYIDMAYCSGIAPPPSVKSYLPISYEDFLRFFKLPDLAE